MPKVIQTKLQAAPPLIKTITKTVEEVNPAPGAPGSEPQLEMGEWFASLSPADRAGHAIYISRLEPDIMITDPRVTNPKWRGGKYLHRFTSDELEGLTGGDFWSALIEWIKPKFGGSKYLLRVTNIKTGQLMYVIPFEVEGDPILSGREGYRQPGGSPGGDGRAGMDGLVLSFLKEQLEQAKAKAMDPSAAVNAVMGMMEKANERALEMALRQIPQQSNPVEQLNAMIGAIEKMGLFKRGSQDEGPLRELIAELRQREEKRSIWDELKTAKDGLSMLGLGRNSGGGENGWVSVAQILAPTIEKVADNVIRAMQMRGMSANVPRNVAAAAPGPRPLMQAQITNQLPPPSVMEPPKPAPASNPQPAPAPAQAEQEAFAREIVTTYIFTKLREQFDAGKEGDAVAEWLDAAERPLANQLGFLSAEQLQNVISRQPLFAPVADHPRMAQFVKDFLSYFQDEEKPGEKGAA